MADEGYTIEIQGMDETLARYMQADQFAVDALVEGMGRSVDLVGTDAAIYPPESEANAPPTPFYQRGVGTMYSDGSTRGESQQMGDKWQKEIVLQNDGVIGTVSNPTTYAPFAHSPLKQVPFHAVRGWRTTVKITADVKDRVVENFKLAAAKVAARLRG